MREMRWRDRDVGRKREGREGREIYTRGEKEKKKKLIIEREAIKLRKIEQLFRVFFLKTHKL